MFASFCINFKGLSVTKNCLGREGLPLILKAKFGDNLLVIFCSMVVFESCVEYWILS